MLTFYFNVNILGKIFYCILTFLPQLYILYIYSNNVLGEVISINIVISNKKDTPIYQQMYDQIKNLIISGELSSGDPLPSIRGIAKDLKISVITTKRAYDELEKDGYIYTVQGKGCFVAEKNKELIMEENLKKIEDHIKDIYEIADICGLEQEEIIKMFILYGEER